MASVLIIAEHREGKILAATYSALSCGKQIADAAGLPLEVAVLGKGVSDLGAALAGRQVAKVHTLDHEALDPYLSEFWAKAVADLVVATGATWVGAASTVQAKDYLPRVAARLDAGMASNVVAVDGTTLTRPMWADAVLADVEITTEKKVFTARPTEFEPLAEGGSAEVVAFAPELDAGAAKVTFAGLELVKSERPSLTEADVVVAGGRGTKGEFGIIEALADALGAAIGSTRAVVDAGWAPNEYQIGQTGKVVAPDLYIGAGISGAIQHLAGMKGSKVIVAINKDEEAPIFQVADYGLVADLFKAIPELIEEIKKAKAG